MLTRRLMLLGLPTLVACDPFFAASSKKPVFHSVDITGANYARELALPDPNGQLHTLADFKGKVTLVFFGFTQCPDMCPSTMVELADIKKSLGTDGERLQVVFVSVDPERDTPEILQAYMTSFDPSFIALRGTPEQTLATAKEFKVYFAKVPGKTEGSYTMDHTVGSYVFDPQGKVRLFMRSGQSSDALTSDLKALLAGA
jgi:protein SCO1